MSKQTHKSRTTKHFPTSEIFSLHKPDLTQKVNLLMRPPATLAAAAHTHTHTAPNKTVRILLPKLKPPLPELLCAVAPTLWPGQRPDPLIPNPVMSWVSGEGLWPLDSPGYISTVANLKVLPSLRIQCLWAEAGGQRIGERRSC